VNTEFCITGTQTRKIGMEVADSEDAPGCFSYPILRFCRKREGRPLLAGARRLVDLGFAG
jgi:hypothetical protein